METDHKPYFIRPNDITLLRKEANDLSLAYVCCFTQLIIAFKQSRSLASEPIINLGSPNTIHRFIELKGMLGYVFTATKVINKAKSANLTVVVSKDKNIITIKNNKNLSIKQQVECWEAFNVELSDLIA